MSSYISKRTVAFIDVLAFKYILNKFQLSIIGKAYTSAIDNVLRAFKDDMIGNRKLETCSINIFSDSIIIYSNDGSEAGFLSVVKCVQRIIQSLILSQFPARGAITFGEMYIDENRKIHAGIPLVETYKLEQEQEWIGVVIDKSLQDQFKVLLDITALPKIGQYSVPLKEENIRDSYVINWLQGLADDTNYIKSLNLLPTKEVFGKEMKCKYMNTIKFIEYIKSL